MTNSFYGLCESANAGCGVPERDIVKVYCSLVRSIMEYASVVFSNLPQCFSSVLEKVQKRALAMIFLELDYEEALAQSGFCSLESRRVEACVRFIHNIQPGNPLYPPPPTSDKHGCPALL